MFTLSVIRGCSMIGFYERGEAQGQAEEKHGPGKGFRLTSGHDGPVFLAEGNDDDESPEDGHAPFQGVDF